MPASPPLVLASLLVLAAVTARAADPVYSALPPLSLVAIEVPGGVPGGEPVSQPLQPCLDTGPSDPPPGVFAGPAPGAAARALPAGWTTYEYLAWFSKGQPLPPLVTTARTGVPVLGSPSTRVLVGGGDHDSPYSGGGRFSAGTALDEAGTVAATATWFFLGTRTDETTVNARANRPRQVGRPFVDALTGERGVIPVGGGGFDGAVRVATNVRVTGWEANGLWSLHATDGVRLHALAGYRFFQASEGLRIDQVAVGPAGLAAGLTDHFDTRNRFHGGQLGLVADLSRGSLTLELAGKVGLGQGATLVDVRGLTVARTEGGGIGATPGGVLALASNSGRSTRTTFAVLPEAMAKVGYRFGSTSRVYLGYNLIYLSEAARPGDQVDGTLDVGQIPLNARPVAAGDRPGPLLVRSDFWVQGLTVGMEYRY